ncbi:MAG: bifunctional 4-hydroxy-2-oxoglutarate aldolase/2-dehydro-3-deoxy-phosphogluconate aldolase [Verrucomicrobia bacterium]|nr:bifunctional 4-hydroxy-2-oxoglutarate aldolase/2-dehydro-3-deoxy-phosphogluconate aldolase [Verrucomicrobiota bacterium]
MRNRSDIDARIVELGIVAVVRAPKTEMAVPICEALVAGGVKCLEITFTVPNAPEAIRQVKRRFGADTVVGAGTVLTAANGQAALDAGADFVVSPIIRLDLIAQAHAAGAPTMIGAYTPTEAQTAFEAGSDFVKIFPADKLGPGYIKALRAPLPHLRIVPTGGVDLQTAPEFLKAGCVALGVGSPLLKPELVKEQNWTELSKLAGEFVRVVKAARAV